MNPPDNESLPQPSRRPRQGWNAHFARMAALGDDQMLDDMLLTTWDEETGWTLSLSDHMDSEYTGANKLERPDSGTN